MSAIPSQRPSSLEERTEINSNVFYIHDFICFSSFRVPKDSPIREIIKIIKRLKIPTLEHLPSILRDRVFTIEKNKKKLEKIEPKYRWRVVISKTMHIVPFGSKVKIIEALSHPRDFRSSMFGRNIATDCEEKKTNSSDCEEKKTESVDFLQLANAAYKRSRRSRQQTRSNRSTISRAQTRFTSPQYSYGESRRMISSSGQMSFRLPQGSINSYQTCDGERVNISRPVDRREVTHPNPRSSTIHESQQQQPIETHELIGDFNGFPEGSC